MERLATVAAFREWQEGLSRALDPEAKVVTICGGTGCTAFGSPAVQQAFEQEIERRGLQDKVTVRRTGCHGFCEKGPVVVILPSKVFYPNVQAEDVPEIVEKTVLAGRAHRAAALRRPRDQPEDHLRPRGPVLRQAAAAGLPPQRHRGPDQPRGLRGARGLRGGRQGPQRDEAGAGHRGGARRRPARARRGGLPHGRQVGPLPQGAGRAEVPHLQRRRGRPGRVHGPQPAGGHPARHHRGHDHRRLRHRRRARHRLRAGRVPAGRQELRHRAGAGARGRAAGRGHPGQRLRLRHRGAAGRRRLRLRRGERHDRLAGGPPRHAAPASAVPRAERLPGQADHHQQRGDAGQRAPHHRPGRAGLRRRRHRGQQGHQDIRAGRQGEQHRPGRGADGRHAARDRLRHRRRHPEEPPLQGRADGRAVRRLRARAVPRPADRLRLRQGDRRHHGLRRPDRHGREHVHGRHRPLLPGVRPERVLRQVRALPRRHAPHARHPAAHLQRRGPRGRRGGAGGAGAGGQGRLASAASARRRPTPC